MGLDGRAEAAEGRSHPRYGPEAPLRASESPAEAGPVAGEREGHVALRGHDRHQESAAGIGSIEAGESDGPKRGAEAFGIQDQLRRRGDQ